MEVNEWSAWCWGCFIPGERASSTHRIGYWAGFIVGVVTEVKRKVPSLGQVFNSSNPACYHPLHWLSYVTCFFYTMKKLPCSVMLGKQVLFIAHVFDKNRGALINTECSTCNLNWILRLCFWTLSVVWFLHQESTAFQKRVLFPSSGVGPVCDSSYVGAQQCVNLFMFSSCEVKRTNSFPEYVILYKKSWIWHSPNKQP